LGQDRFQDILKGMKDNERYNTMSQIFGTEHFYEFRTTINEAKQKLALRQSTVQAKQKATELEAEKLKTRLEILQQQMIFGQDDFKNRQKTVTDYVQSEKIEINWASESLYKDIAGRIADRKKTVENDRLRIQNERIALINIEDRIPETIQYIENEKVLKLKAERLETAKRVKRIRLELDWLNQQIDTFLSANAICKRLEEQYTDYTERAEKTSKHTDLFRQFIKDLQTTLAIGRGTESYKDSLKLAQGNSHLQPEIKIRVTEHLTNIQIAQSNKLAAEQVFKQSKQLTEHINSTIVGKTEQHRKLQVFLSAVRAFVQENAQSSSCPACGTPGISAEHLLSYTQQQQQMIDPDLVELQKAYELALREMASKQSELNDASARYSEAHERLETLIHEYEEFCRQSEKDTSELYSLAAETNLRLVDSRKLTEQFMQRASQLDLEINQESLKPSIKSMILRLDDEWKILSDLLGIGETADIDQLILDCETAIRKADNQLLLISLEFSPYNITFIRDLEWIREELVKKIADLLRGYSFKLAAFDDEIGNLVKVEEDAQFIDRHKKYIAAELKYKEESEKKEKAAIEYEALLQKIRILDELQKNVPIAVDKLNDQVINNLFDSIQQIFEKLNCHPLYRKLSFSTNHRYRANRLLLSVLADSEEIEVNAANPSYIFSSAQENTLVLSFFMAMAQRQQWSPMSLIALDDPLQSMDDLNVLSFIDLMRDFADKSVGWGKQIIISTHDLTFYELMRKKFRHLDIGVVEFESYGTGGPVIRNDGLQAVHRFPAEPRVEFSADFLLQQ
jgi:exonuclease SbcC